MHGLSFPSLQNFLLVAIGIGVGGDLETKWCVAQNWEMNVVLCGWLVFLFSSVFKMVGLFLMLMHWGHIWKWYSKC